MGRSKNRKKRRLGRIDKQAEITEPMLPYYEFKTRCDIRFDIWCGFEKWFDAAETEAVESYDEQDEKELEMITVPGKYGYRAEFPNATEYGCLRRQAKHLKTYLEFDDGSIKEKFYHSKKATYYRTKRIKEFIEWFRDMFEKQYREVEKAEPEKIEDWVKELMGR